MTSDGVPPRRWVGRLVLLAWRLFLLACLTAALAVAWVAVALMGLQTENICFERAPADYTGLTQSVELWPPTAACRYTTDRGVVINTREDGEVQRRVTFVAIAGVLAIGAWVLLARRVLRSRWTRGGISQRGRAHDPSRR